MGRVRVKLFIVWRYLTSPCMVLIVTWMLGALGCTPHEDTDIESQAVATNVAESTKSRAAQDASSSTAYANGDFNNFLASIIEVLANRDRYHGKRVQVEGYLELEFEGTAIYLSKESADHAMTSNGFWVSFDKAAVPFDGTCGPMQFHRKYVLIEGTFNKRKRGHGGAWQGSIEKIDRIVELQ